MSSVEYTDDFVRAALDRLRDEMPAAVADVNAAYGVSEGDPMFLSTPAGEAYDDGTGLRTLNPWIEVTIGEDELHGQEPSGYFPLGLMHAIAVFPLVALVHLEEPVPGPALHAKLKRYAHCVTHCLADPAAFADYAPALRRVRRVWRLSETAKDEAASFAFLRFEFETDRAL